MFARQLGPATAEPSRVDPLGASNTRAPLSCQLGKVSHCSPADLRYVTAGACGPPLRANNHTLWLNLETRDSRARQLVANLEFAGTNFEPPILQALDWVGKNCSFACEKARAKRYRMLSDNNATRTGATGARQAAGDMKGAGAGLAPANGRARPRGPARKLIRIEWQFESTIKSAAHLVGQAGPC